MVPCPEARRGAVVGDVRSSRSANAARCAIEVTGRARVHGIEGVELTAREISCADEKKVTERTFVAQLTDTHCGYLAMFRDDRGVREYVTFLDGDAFLPELGLAAKTTAATRPTFLRRAISAGRGRS